MKMKLFSLILVFALTIISILPSNATDTTEASWGDSVDALTSSGTFLEAVAASNASASPTYIRLNTDVFLSQTADFSTVDTTLDLNGKIITAANVIALTLTDGHLTITDENTDIGSIISTGTSYPAIKVDAGILNLNAPVNLTGFHGLQQTGGTVNINSSPVIKSTNSSDPTALYVSGGIFYGNDTNFTAVSGDVTFYSCTANNVNCTVIGALSTAIRIINCTDVTITGGSYSVGGEYGMSISSSTIKLRGGIFGGTTSAIYTDDTSTISGVIDTGYKYIDANGNEIKDESALAGATVLRVVVSTAASTQDQPVYGVYTNDGPVTPTVYSVDIVWGSMEFTYYAGGTTRVWDPDTHTYTEVTGQSQWSCTEGANRITITNHSNTAVIANLAYSPIDGFNSITGTFDQSSISLEAPIEGSDVSTAPTGSVYLTLSGELSEHVTTKMQIGSITIAIQ